MEIVVFNKEVHSVSNFDCGNKEINNYLKEILLKDLLKNACRCFVLKQKNSSSIIGYITLSASSIQKSEIKNLTNKARKELPSYLKIPTMLIGRLGVDKAYQEKKLGDLLIYKAFDIANQLPIGISAITVEIKSEDLVQYYHRLGFMQLLTEGKHPDRKSSS